MSAEQTDVLTILRRATVRADPSESSVTGDVLRSSLLAQPGLALNNVIFAPGARTRWHAHGGPQILMVSDGVGWVQLRGDPSQLVAIGDVVMIPPGYEHWHGADVNSFFVHLGVTVGGTEWRAEVEDDEYLAAVVR